MDSIKEGVEWGGVGCCGPDEIVSITVVFGTLSTIMPLLSYYNSQFSLLLCPTRPVGPTGLIFSRGHPGMFLV